MAETEEPNSVLVNEACGYYTVTRDESIIFLSKGKGMLLSFISIIRSNLYIFKKIINMKFSLQLSVTLYLIPSYHPICIHGSQRSLTLPVVNEEMSV